jgi:hypothetical protein
MIARRVWIPDVGTYEVRNAQEPLTLQTEKLRSLKAGKQDQ